MRMIVVKIKDIEQLSNCPGQCGRPKGHPRDGRCSAGWPPNDAEGRIITGTEKLIEQTREIIENENEEYRDVGRWFVENAPEILARLEWVKNSGGWREL